MFYFDDEPSFIKSQKPVRQIYDYSRTRKNDQILILYRMFGDDSLAYFLGYWC